MKFSELTITRNDSKYIVNAFNDPAGDFVIAVYFSEEVAIYALNYVLTEGKLPECDCGNRDIYSLAKGFDKIDPMCSVCYDNLRGFSWDAELEMRESN